MPRSLTACACSGVAPRKNAAQWTTASTPRTAAASESTSSRSPSASSMRASRRSAARAGSRTRARTWSPRWASRLVSRLPTFPVAPVTRIFMCRTIATGARRRLEKTDKRPGACATSRAQPESPHARERRSPRPHCAERVDRVRCVGAVRVRLRPRRSRRRDSASRDPSRRSLRAVGAKRSRRPRVRRATEGASKAHPPRAAERDGAPSAGRAGGGARRAGLRTGRAHRRARGSLGRRRDAATVRSARRRARHGRCGRNPGERDCRTPRDREWAPRPPRNSPSLPPTG